MDKKQGFASVHLSTEAVVFFDGWSSDSRGSMSRMCPRTFCGEFFSWIKNVCVYTFVTETQTWIKMRWLVAAMRGDL